MILLLWVSRKLSMLQPYSTVNGSGIDGAEVIKKSIRLGWAKESTSTQGIFVKWLPLVSSCTSQSIVVNYSIKVLLKTKSCNDANFVFTSGTACILYDNQRCLQWQQSWHCDDSWFSVVLLVGIHCFIINPLHAESLLKIIYGISFL